MPLFCTRILWLLRAFSQLQLSLGRERLLGVSPYSAFPASLQHGLGCTWSRRLERFTEAGWASAVNPQGLEGGLTWFFSVPILFPADLDNFPLTNFYLTLRDNCTCFCDLSAFTPLLWWEMAMVAGSLPCVEVF